MGSILRYTAVAAAFAAFLMVAGVSSMARAEIGVAAQHFDDPKPVGDARYSYLFWDVYDARLVAPGGVYRRGGPLKLTLTYLRDFESEAIIESTEKEIRRQEGTDESKLASWRDALSGIFPNVLKNDSISGVRDETGQTFFYVNGAYAGTVADPEFGRRFFDIWLGPESRDQGAPSATSTPPEPLAASPAHSPPAFISFRIRHPHHRLDSRPCSCLYGHPVRVWRTLTGVLFILPLAIGGTLLADRLDWLDGFCLRETNYFCIRIVAEERDGEEVRKLILDRLVHSFNSLENPLKLTYGYEHMYAEITEVVMTSRDEPAALFIGGGATLPALHGNHLAG